MKTLKGGPLMYITVYWSLLTDMSYLDLQPNIAQTNRFGMIHWHYLLHYSVYSYVFHGHHYK